jgi:transcriptional regulator with XRE-family HTH domain
MDKIASRIKELIKNHGISNGDFAKKVGLNPSIVSHILSGRNKVSLQVILQIKEAFPEVDLSYLLTGSATINSPSSPTPINAISETELKTVAEPEKENSSKEIPILPSEAKKTNESKAIERVIILYTDKSMDSYTP